MDEEDGKRRQVNDQNNNTVVVSKIMQRFRPIAPKPPVGESSEDTKSCGFLGRNRRSKRKYVKNNTNGGTSKNSKKNVNLDGEIIREGSIVTLQLLPEKDIDLGSNQDPEDKYPKTGSIVGLSSSVDRTVVESWLTVECVSDTCTDLLELNSMNQEGEERMMRTLDVDTCPWLVSDESNRVYWVNRAYRRMVIGDPDVEEAVIRVWLVVPMDLMEAISCMVELNGVVTCRVRVKYEPMVKMTSVPCDVWRVRSSGGFAWRLDVDSALRLGR